MRAIDLRRSGNVEPSEFQPGKVPSITHDGVGLVIKTWRKLDSTLKRMLEAEGVSDFVRKDAEALYPIERLESGPSR